MAWHVMSDEGNGRNVNRWRVPYGMCAPTSSMKLVEVSQITAEQVYPGTTNATPAK